MTRENIMNLSERIEPIVCGDYTVRLAETEKEIKQAQKLRFDALRLDYNASAESEDGTDCDEYDEYCAHMLVIYGSGGSSEVVATYRLISEDHLEHLKKFLSETEFDMSALRRNKEGKILELGRAVVAPEHRNGIVIKILWNGIERYALTYGVRYLIGTASFHGLDAQQYIQGYSYLMNNYKMEESVLARADFDRADVTPLPPEQTDKKTAAAQIPPLIKSYLRMGAKFGDGFYIDRWFNCLDLFIFLDMNAMAKKYLKNKQQ